MSQPEEHVPSYDSTMDYLYSLAIRLGLCPNLSDWFRSCGGGSGQDDNGSRDFGRDNNNDNSDGSGSQDPIQDFCAAVKRGDYADAETLLTLIPQTRTVPAAAQLFCGLVVSDPLSRN